MTKKIFITRQVPELAIKMLRDKGYEVKVGDFKLPPTKKTAHACSEGL